MLRGIVTAVAISAATVTAHAEVWMVKTTNAVGCRDRQTLIELDASSAASKRGNGSPEGCVVLYSGERLLEQVELGQGFNKYMKVERGDGSMLFVRNSEVVSDPGIGSVSEDRANQ